MANGRQIRSLEDLHDAMLEKRAVTGHNYLGGPGSKRPAAFVINMTGFMILMMIRAGLYIWEKEEEHE